MAEEKHDDQKRDNPNSGFENFQRLLEGALAIPKEELDKRRAEYKRAKEQRGRGSR